MSMLARMRAHLPGGVLGSERHVMHVQTRTPGKHTCNPRQRARARECGGWHKKSHSLGMGN